MTYTEYLQSDTWRTIRRQRLDLDNYECVLCGDRAEHVHHRRYPDELVMESISDLVSLCYNCHQKHHGYLYGTSDSREYHTMLIRLAELQDRVVDLEYKIHKIEWGIE